jgi:peptidoglycan lytic transglycosylase
MNSINSGGVRVIEEHSWVGIRGALVALAVAAGLSACAAPSPVAIAPPLPSVPPPPVAHQEKTPSFTQTGLASWYGKTRKTKRTASGEKLDNKAMTAAHRSLPMNTIVRVTNLSNGASVVVRINDRGPFVAGRVIDVSPAAASGLGMKEAGIAPVRLEVFAADQATPSPVTASAN